MSRHTREIIRQVEEIERDLEWREEELWEAKQEINQLKNQLNWHRERQGKQTEEMNDLRLHNEMLEKALEQALYTNDIYREQLLKEGILKNDPGRTLEKVSGINCMKCGRILIGKDSGKKYCFPCYKEWAQGMGIWRGFPLENTLDLNNEGVNNEGQEYPEKRNIDLNREDAEENS